MDITIHASFLPHDDPDASLAFYRDTLGFEVRNDVGYGGMRWITVGPKTSCAEPVGNRRSDLRRRHREHVLRVGAAVWLAGPWSWA